MNNIRTACIIIVVCCFVYSHGGSLIQEQQCPDGCCSGKTCGSEGNSDTETWTCSDTSGNANLKLKNCYVKAEGTQSSCTTADCPCTTGNSPCVSCTKYSNGAQVCTCVAGRRNKDCGGTDASMASCKVYTRNGICIQRCTTTTSGVQILDCQDSLCQGPSIPQRCSARRF